MAFEAYYRPRGRCDRVSNSSRVHCHLLPTDARGSDGLRHPLEVRGIGVAHPANTGVDQHLEAMETGAVGDVDVTSLNRHTRFGGLCDRVDLGMDGAETVLLDFTVRGG